MLTRLIAASLRHPVAVNRGWLAIASAGLVAFGRLPLDAFPDTTPVQVQVHTTATALSPLEIERQITAPVETALSGLPGLEEVRSLSRFGFSQVSLLFEDGTDLWRARQVVAERLASVELPEGISPPRLGPVATGLGEIFHYLVTGDGKSLAELRTVQDWIIRPRLRSVGGVAEVVSWGGDERQIHVIVDPARLLAQGVTLDQLAEAVEKNNANVGAGALEGPGESRLVQGVALLTRPEEIGDIVVSSRAGVPVRVSDLARIVEGRDIRHGAVTADGRGEAVLGLGFLLVGGNSREVTGKLAARLDEIRRTLPAGIHAEPVYERTDLVDHVLSTVRLNLFEGALLVIAVLFAFLGHFRAGLIVASAIPLSMLFAFNLMLQAGIAGSLMSLGALDFGLIVDSAVIQIENCVRRLHESRSDSGDDSRRASEETGLGGGGGNRPRPSDEAAALASDRPASPTRREIVRDAVLEVRRPTLFGELIIAIVYLPILALVGVEGKLFRPMALTVLFALAGSLLLSMTLIPVLASVLLPRHPRRADPPLARWLQRLYAPLLGGALARPRVVSLAALALLACAGLLVPRLGSEFVPRLREGTIVINTVRLASVSLDESVRYGSRIEAMLSLRFPDEIERIWTRTGSADVATDPMGVELSDIFIALTPRQQWTRARTQDELVSAMSEEMSALPGMRAVFTQPIEMRVNEMISGVRSDVGVKLFGDDFEMLKARAREIEATLRTIPGASDVVTEQITGQPLLQVEVDRAAAGRLGIPARAVLETVEALGSRRLGFLQDGERRVPIALRLEEDYRSSPEALGRVPVAASAESGGASVREGGAGSDGLPGEERSAALFPASAPLSRLARIRATEGPAAIQREWGRRRIVIQANVRGRDVGSFVAQAREEIGRLVSLPPGYHVEFGGQFEHFERARRRLAFVVPAALVLIFVLLYATYGRLLDAARVFTGVPFAAAGGILALWLRGLPFSVSAGVGFVALSGVSVLADMVLVSTIRQMHSAGLPLREAIEAAALRRLRPVLMTALVASLGFVPMALNTGIGAEVQRPLATVVIGGVVSSTLLTLVVLPALYAVLARDRIRESG